MKSLSTLAEWTEQRPPELQKPHSELTSDERVAVDAWVSQQFRRKNFFLIKSNDGMVACDRTPLDPLAFVIEGELTSRASKHLKVLRPNFPHGEQLVAGHVILLEATAEELIARAKERHRGADADYLREQQRRLRDLLCAPGPGVTVLSTSARTISSVVRAVCKLIHLGEYSEFDLDARLSVLAGETT